MTSFALMCSLDKTHSLHIGRFLWQLSISTVSCCHIQGHFHSSVLDTVFWITGEHSANNTNATFARSNDLFKQVVLMGL